MKLIPLLAFLVSGTAYAFQGPIRVSVDSFGALANGHSTSPLLSGTGRYVAFASEASNLVPGDLNGVSDVFVRDTFLGTTRRASVSSLGIEGDRASSRVLAMSADGFLVVFTSNARNLVLEGGTDGAVYAHSLLDGSTQLLTRSIAGIPVPGGGGAAVSDDKRYVVFDSLSDGLVPGDSDHTIDVFIRDLSLQTTIRIPRALGPNLVPTRLPVISGNGRFVAHLAPQDPGDQVVLHDRDVDADGIYDEPGATSTTVLQQPAQLQGNYFVAVQMSQDGRFIGIGTDTPFGTTSIDRDSDEDGIYDEAGATDFIVAIPDAYLSSMSGTGRYLASRRQQPLWQALVIDVDSGLGGVVSRDPVSGAPSNGHVFGITISRDGNWIAGATDATNLDVNDTNGVRDIYLFPRTLSHCVGSSTYCVGAPNSVGSGALIGWAGSPSISEGSFVLTAVGCPPNTSGIFFYGPGQTQVPWGNGFLCVDAGGVGLFRLGVTHMNALGHAAHLLNFGNPPAGSGPGQILPGSVWSFQLYYRNPAGGGAGFNSSNGLRASFCP